MACKYRLSSSQDIDPSILLISSFRRALSSSREANQIIFFAFSSFVRPFRSRASSRPFAFWCAPLFFSRSSAKQSTFFFYSSSDSYRSSPSSFWCSTLFFENQRQRSPIFLGVSALLTDIERRLKFSLLNLSYSAFFQSMEGLKSFLTCSEKRLSLSLISLSLWSSYSCCDSKYNFSSFQIFLQKADLQKTAAESGLLLFFLFLQAPNRYFCINSYLFAWASSSCLSMGLWRLLISASRFFFSQSCSFCKRRYQFSIFSAIVFQDSFCRRLFYWLFCISALTLRCYSRAFIFYKTYCFLFSLLYSFSLSISSFCLSSSCCRRSSSIFNASLFFQMSSFRYCSIFLINCSRSS